MASINQVLRVLCCVEDEYSDWMTRNPLLQPSFDYMWAKYHRQVPRVISPCLLAIEQHHREQVCNQLKWGYTPRTLDLILVKLCMEARGAAF
jgi:hypothetical protein